jgi:methionyl-tRNA formyltransferase
VINGEPTVACSDGALKLERLQRAGRSPMEARDFLRGFPLQTGDRL